MEKYVNDGFEVLKNLPIDDDEIKGKINKIQKKYDEFNNHQDRYTEKYRQMMINQFNGFDILNHIYVSHGGKKRSIVGQENFDEEINNIDNSLTRYCEKLDALKYLDFLQDENRNVIMIGANGCGKTTLLRYLIDNTGASDIDYYQADRLLVLNEHYNPERNMDTFIKSMNSTHNLATNINNEYQSDHIKQQFDQTIALFEKRRAIENDKALPNKDKITDYILKAWNSLVVDRILYSEGELKVKTTSGIPYKLKLMSSGEKNILYFLINILLKDEKKYYFIDEPENSLNPAIISRLWDIIEKKRKNSIFVYLTHNSEFVTSRINAKIYWIQKYEGNNIWKYEPLKENDNLPQELMISLLGNRQPVIFCESENENKKDTLLFKLLFPNFKIVSAGGCAKVASKVKAYKEAGLPQTAYGIIDCDYKREDMLEGYTKKGIYHLPFFEIENFFVCKKILDPFLKCYSTNCNAMNNIEAKVKELFINSMEKFIIRNVAHALHELTYQEKIKSINNIEELKSNFSSYISKIDVQSLIDKFELKFNEIVDKDDYDYFLRYLDYKNIINELEKIMEIDNSYTYEKLILDYLHNNEELLNDIRVSYFPNIIY